MAGGYDSLSWFKERIKRLLHTDVVDVEPLISELDGPKPQPVKQIDVKPLISELDEVQSDDD